MEPGQPVYSAIIDHFGRTVVLPDGQLDRAALAKAAFADGRVEELNAIVHPAVIARQAQLTESIVAHDPRAIVIVESALIFETKYGSSQHSDSKPWHTRFDRIILVTAPEELKIARFVARSSADNAMTGERRAELEVEARRRLSQQISDEQKSALCDYVLTNSGALSELEWQVDRLWPILKAAAE
jgi:dephospho-CoA kinase